MNISRYLKVGIFFLSLGIAGTGYVVLSSDGFNGWNTKDYEVVIDDATGLTTNSKVFLAGVPVGKIREIDLSGGQAVLRVAFLKDVQIRSDAQISRRSSSLLGTSVLTLTPGTELTPLVREGGRIEASKGGGDMSAAVGSVQELSVQISGLLKEFQERQMQLLAVSLETFNSLAHKLDERSDAELDRISRILESSALITEHFEALLSDRDSDLNASASEVRAALENIRAISAEIRSGEGNIGRAIYDDELYRTLLATAERTEEAAGKLNQALDSVNQLATDADKVVVDAGDIVSKATGLGVQVDSRAQWDVLSATARGGASLRLTPRKGDRWYQIGVSSVPNGVSSRTVTETTGTGGDTRVETTKTTFSAAFDAEIARRFGPLTLRGGLIESTAGVGLDYQPIPWLELSGELFDFGSDSVPNLRGTATIYPFFDPASDRPWNWLYIRGGVDAALDSENRDYFLGAGVRFTDEEVRGLVGLIPLTQ